MLPQHSKKFKALRDLIRARAESASGEIIYIPNKGNGGDSFITEGTYQFVEDLGLPWRMQTLLDPVPEGSHIILGGGGNLVAPYPNYRDFLTQNMHRWASLVLLPHTIRAYPEILGALNDTCDIYCRESPSLDYCKEHLTGGARLHECHDMAFYWQPERTKAEVSGAVLANLTNRTYLIRAAKFLVRDRLATRLIRDGKLLALREDVESAGVLVPEHSVDVSQIFSTEGVTRKYAASATWAMSRLLDKADVVETDRLHAAVMSALLGKKVFMRDNSYGKNRSIWEYSMKDIFPNVELLDGTDDVRLT